MVYGPSWDVEMKYFENDDIVYKVQTVSYNAL